MSRKIDTSASPVRPAGFHPGSLGEIIIDTRRDGERGWEVAEEEKEEEEGGKREKRGRRGTMARV